MRVRAVLAALDMTAKRGSAANLDCRHDASLSEVQVIGVGRAPRLTVAAEDIRHLQNRSHGAAQPGGTTSRRRRSSGLGVLLMVLVATWV